MTIVDRSPGSQPRLIVRSPQGLARRTTKSTGVETGVSKPDTAPEMEFPATINQDPDTTRGGQPRSRYESPLIE
jgi:hypothetical protein